MLSLSLSPLSRTQNEKPKTKETPLSYHPDVVARRLRLVQRDVLPDEHADPDPREVETVEEGVDLGELVQTRQPPPRPLGRGRTRFLVVLAEKLLLELGDTHRHHWNDVLVPLVDRPEQIRECPFIVRVLNLGELPEVGERADIPVSDFEDMRLCGQTIG